MNKILQGNRQTRYRWPPSFGGPTFDFFSVYNGVKERNAISRNCALSFEL